MRAFRGYRTIQGPEQLLFSGRRVDSPAAYLAWHAASVRAGGGRTWTSPEPVEAEINHGRWIALCFWCDTGMLTRPDWRIACCAQCGARYMGDQVIFPDNADAIAAVLCRRIQRAQQNWGKRQTLHELELENRQPECITP